MICCVDPVFQSIYARDSFTSFEMSWIRSIDRDLWHEVKIRIGS